MLRNTNKPFAQRTRERNWELFRIKGLRACVLPMVAKYTGSNSARMETVTEIFDELEATVKAMQEEDRRLTL